MPKNAKQIREASYHYHNGESFAAIAKRMGIASPTTVFRWSKTQIWTEEMASLEEQTRQELLRECSESLQKTQKRLELSGLSAIEISVRLLSKIQRLCDRLDVEAIDSPKEQVSAINALSRGYATLTDSGKVLWMEAIGLDEVIEQLDLERLD